MAPTPKRFENFSEFWPYYLSEHRHPVCRRLHFVGTTLALAVILGAACLSPALLAVAPVVGYGPAWIGHFFFEKNRPATFRYPLWSLRADFKMYGLMLRGKLP